jgi:Family of unknown function (DUF6221)
VAEVTLAGFLAARLDEDEAVARATSRPAWREWYVEPWYDGGFQADGRTMRADVGGMRGGGLFTGQGALDTVLADHIARHDPARVLREVEAKRAILARYEDCLIRMEDPEYPNAVARDQAREYEDFVLPDLASAWAGHPDYDEAWKP